MGRHNRWIKDPSRAGEKIVHRSFKQARQFLHQRSQRLKMKAEKEARREARAARQAAEAQAALEAIAAPELDFEEGICNISLCLWVI
jgi:hypothetical protein